VAVESCSSITSGLLLQQLNAATVLTSCKKQQKKETMSL